MAKLEVRDFDKPDETRPFTGKGRADVLMLAGRQLSRGVFESGWRWSNNVKPIAGTDSCEVLHVGYCLEGRMRIHMNDGTEQDIGSGDAFVIPPGHDAEVIGDSDCVLLDVGEISDYAKPR